MHKYFNLIRKYHSNISEKKLNTYNKLFDIYEKINVKINLISRKDFENFYLHHILHSLSIIKFELIPKKKLKIVDLGTGGGIPGIPLAIFYDDNKFFLVDSIRKKIKSVDRIIKELELENVKTYNDRIENLEFNADIIICRSVSSIKNILKWTKNSLKKNGKIILLKGGDVDKELININKRFTIYNIDSIYSDDYFQNKKIIEIQA
ncbi:MAG: 16S rRNA (guanine(527)-N(7))-methyltransferase RsmG [Cytophagales bacterium]|nr:MAG: 16S rRNA (guanine(527)-N(7))-methyltransferase RsmG [Rhodothermaeota bacterium MED-G19]